MEQNMSAVSKSGDEHMDTEAVVLPEILRNIKLNIWIKISSRDKHII